MIQVTRKKARAFDLREKASAGILKEEVGPCLRTQVRVARSPAIGIDTMDPLVAKKVRDRLNPRGRIHIVRDKSGEFSHGIGAKRENARMFADQGAWAPRLDRMTSQAVNAGVGGKSPRGSFQLLAEVIEPPDRQMTFLDEPGDARLQHHAGLMGNPSRIGRDEPQQVLIQVCVREVGTRNASFTHAEEGEEEEEEKGVGGGGRWRGKGVAGGSRGSEPRAHRAVGRDSSITGNGPAPASQVAPGTAASPTRTQPRRGNTEETVKSPKRSDPNEARPVQTVNSRIVKVALLVSPDQSGGH